MSNEPAVQHQGPPVRPAPRSVSRIALFYALYGAFFFIVVVVFLFVEPQRWNNPPRITQTQSGTFQLADRSFSWQLSCNCPAVATDGQRLSLPFTLTLVPLAKSSAATSLAKTSLGVDAGSAAISLEDASLSARAIQINDPAVVPYGQTQILPLTVQLSGVTSDLVQIAFTVTRYDQTSPSGSVLFTTAWPLHGRPDFKQFIEPWLYASCVILAAAGLLYAWIRRLHTLRERTERKLAEAQTRAAANPEAARFAWDLARVKLEAYFDRNLIQVNLVFWVAAIVMGVGFCFVLAGVWLAYINPDQIRPPLVAAISGIVTQFIGATFMVIYRSIMAQANEFMTVLERINSVGMAVQVLDSLRDGTDLKDSTRARIATLLLSQPRNIPASSDPSTRGGQPFRPAGTS